MSKKNIKGQGRFISLLFLLIVLSTPILAIDISIISPENSLLNTKEIQLLATINSEINLTNYSIAIDSNITIRNTTQKNIAIQENYTLNEGQHTIKICASNINNETECKEKTITIDLSPPRILLLKPNNEEINSRETKIEVLVDEQSQCKFSDKNESFESMQSLETLDNLLFKKVVTDLSEGEHTYYIKCEDLAKNINSAKLSFLVNLPPTINIDIENARYIDSTYILKSGTYPIVITASEPLKSITLYYSFNDESSKHLITLIPNEDKTIWKGYLIISKGTQNKAGIFTVNAKDFDDLSVSLTPTMFLIDTIPPDTVDSFSFIKGNHSIKLQWHHPYEDEVVTYRVYRKESPGVSYTDYIGETNNTHFTDTNIEEGKTYYYRVSAIDKAGNEGLLSQELKVVLEKKQEKPRLDPEVEDKLNQTMREVNILLLNIDATIQYFDSLDDEEARISNILGLGSMLRGIKNKVVTQKNTLKSITPSMKKEEALKKIDSIDKAVKNYEKSIPKSIEILTKKSWMQEQEQPTFLNDYLLKKYSSIEDIDKKQLLSEIRKLNEEVTINCEATKVRVIYQDGQEKVFIIISKEFNSQTELNNLDILEYIPKTLADSVSKITFRESPVVVKSDPIVYWSYLSSITYYVEGADINNALETKTVLIPVIQKNDNSITGNMVKDTQTNKSYIGFIIGIIALIAVFSYIFIPRTENRGIDTFTSKIDTYNDLLRRYNLLKRDPRNRDLAQKMLPSLKKLYYEILIEQKLKEAEEIANNNDIASMPVMIDDLQELIQRSQSLSIDPQLINRVKRAISVLKSLSMKNDPLLRGLGVGE